MKFATAAVALTAAHLSVAAPHPGPKPDIGLNDLAKSAGLLYFGTAIDNPSLNNSRYLEIAYDNNEFGQVTPANGQKVSQKRMREAFIINANTSMQWMYIEPERNVFNFTMGDQIIKPAIRHGGFFARVVATKQK